MNFLYLFQQRPHFDKQPKKLIESVFFMELQNIFVLSTTNKITKKNNYY